MFTVIYVHAQSIVMPVCNGAVWLDQALDSILAQTFTGSMELSVFNDGSTVSMHTVFHIILEKKNPEYFERP